MTAALDGLARLFASHAADALVEGTLVALIAWIALRLLGRSSAATRFAVLLSALATAAGLPLLRAAVGAHGAATGHSLVLRVGGPWAIAFLLAWTVFAVVALARVSSGVWRIRKLRRHCRELDEPQLQAEFAEAARRFCPGRRVTLLISREIEVPAAIGFVRPAVILPAWLLNELPAPELRHVVMHELAHLSRWDDWTNLFQKIVKALLFFHPAVWWLESRLSLDREMACDDAVVKQSGSARKYAECLVRIAEHRLLRRGLALAQAAVGQVKQISLRVARMLQVDGTAPAPLGRSAVALGSLLTAAALGLLWQAPLFVSFRRPAPAIPAVVAHAQQSPAVVNAAWHGSATPEPMVRKAVWHPRKAPAAVRTSVLQAKAQPSPNLVQTGNTTGGDYEVLVVVFRTGNGDEVWQFAVWQLPAAQRVPVRKTT